MPETVNQIAIFVPMLVLVALTVVAFVRLIVGRAGAMKAGLSPDYYRAHVGGPEPEAVKITARHWDNLFELATLLYAGCIAAYAIGAVSGWTLLFAWGYVVMRLVQSAIHLTYNNPAHRGGAFAVGMLFLIALWVDIAMAVFAQL